MNSFRVIGCAAFLAALAPLTPAFSQDPAPPAAQAAQQDPLKDIRTKDAIADEDRTKVNQWVDGQITAIQSGDLVAAEQAVRLLRENRNGSNAYKEVYAAAAIRAIGGAVKNANLSGAAQMIAVLGELNEAPATEVLVQAIKDERAAVRTAAAVGLRKLRARISIAGGKFFSDTVESLREAALKESSAVALKAMYQALDYPEAVPNPPEPRTLVEAVLTILEARAEQYASGSVRAEGADVQGLRTAHSLRSVMGPAEQKRYQTVLGRILMSAVKRYTSAEKTDEGVRLPAQLRRDTELLIMEAEKQLAELLPAPAGAKPNITRQMEKVDLAFMKIEFNKWAAELKKATEQDFNLEVEAADKQDGG